MGLLYMLEGFSYYRTPEGTDPCGKLLGLGKYGFIGGSFCALYDSIMWSHCVNARQFFNTYSFWVIPLTTMGFAFAGVTYTLCNVRKKDDTLNYIGGALAAGSICHHWLQNPRISGWATGLMVIYAVLKKQAILDGQNRQIILTEPDEEKHRKWYLSWRNLPDRNFSSAPKYPHDKEDYYLHHY